MRTRLTLHLVVMLCAITSSAVAQQNERARFLQRHLAAAQRYEQMKSLRRQLRKLYLAELIEAMDEDLELTDEQIHRLRVASKGAVDYSFLDEERIQTARVIDRPIFSYPVGPLPPQRFLGKSLPFIPLTRSDAAFAARHGVWNKTLKRMFTKEQLTRIELLHREQRERWDDQTRFGLYVMHARALESRQ